MDKNSPCAIKTKRKMADALKELMNTTSFEKITVSDITEQCGIHRQTFYYHFQDRYELLDWLVYTELLQPLVTDFSFDNMYAKFLEAFQTMYRDKRFYQGALKINSNDLISYISRIARDQFIGTLRVLGESNAIEVENAEEDMMFSEFFGYGLSGVVMSWVQRGMKESPEMMTESIEHLVEICKKISVNRQR